MGMTPEDSTILSLFEARCEDAVAECERKYGGYCKAIALRILGNGEDAEECVNDTLLAAWNSIPPAKPVCFRLYLAKLARNAALHRYEKRAAEKRGGGELPAVLEELAECLSGGELPEEAVLAEELERAVLRFLHTLPRRERVLFLRRCFFTEPVRDIAARFGMRENAVAVSLSRTRKKLKKFLVKEGFLSS